MIHDIKELNFPAYATLSQATVSLNDMGERTITTQIKIDGGIKPDFSYDWEIEFMGERYVHSLRSPQALKDNSSVDSKIDLVFQHWVIRELKRHYFVQLAPVKAGTVIPDKYITPLVLNIVDFITAFKEVLDYYYGGAISIELNPDIEYSQDRANVDISYSYIWDVLQKIYDIYGVRWHIEGNVIKVGYPAPEISHIFEYGYNTGLISIERQVQDADIRNSLIGRGGSQNLPKYYFKNAPEGSPYASDPDAIPELEYIYITELRSKTFRDYVQGWKTNPNRDTKEGTIAIEPYDAERGEIDYAYRKGHEDKTFDPIEYINDDNSISKYGLYRGGLDNNTEIYPSIQNISIPGIGLVNEIIAVEPVLSDNVEESTANKGVVYTQPDQKQTVVLNDILDDGIINQYSFLINLDNVYVAEDEIGTLSYATSLIVKDQNGLDNSLYEVKSKGITIKNILGGSENEGAVYDNGAYLPHGLYTVSVHCYVKCLTTIDTLTVTFSVEGVNFVTRKKDHSSTEWKPTFDIWVKNVWQTEKLLTETDEEYADRVWLPILGDEGREAMVTFSSGWLASSEGWEFMIVKKGYAYDTSRSYNGVPSHWRLTLQKSDAELEATDKYIPNMGMQAVAGDTFFLTNIDMQHQYVLYGEQRVMDYIYDNLQKTKDIQPVWVSKFDKIRINTLEEGDIQLLAKGIKVGALIRLTDRRFTDGEIIQYIQSITYTYSDKIYPEIEVVLSDKIQTVESPVQQIEGQIELLSAQIAKPNASLIKQIRQIFDAIYLRKDGVEDLSKSPTSFSSLIKSNDFRTGMLGGQGWAVYRDINGNTVAEFDQVKARQKFTANDIVRNEVKHQGGMIVRSAAMIEVSSVVENEDSFDCYFDQKQGTVANLFAVDDVAYCQAFNAKEQTLRYYKRRVLLCELNYIRLSKTDVNGTGIPQEGDTIIHYGSYTDKNRQFVIISDVIGGGYDRMLSELDSVNATGKEYYFAGRVNGGNPEWFVGDRDGDFAEWRNGVFRIKGGLAVGSEVGGATVVDGGLVTAETISLGSGGNIKAGATGDGSADEDVRFWAGASFEDRANASYRVLQNGTLYASKGVFAGFVKSGTTRITGDNYTEYLTITSLENYVFDIEKCSPCIIFETGSLVPNITLEFPDMQREEALAGLPQSEIDKIRGFIGSTMVIYNNSNSKIKFRVVGISGERKEQTDWEITKNGFIKLTCNVNALQSDTIGAKIEYIYWNMSFKGTQMAFTTT